MGLEEIRLQGFYWLVKDVGQIKGQLQFNRTLYYARKLSNSPLAAKLRIKKRAKRASSGNLKGLRDHLL